MVSTIITITTRTLVSCVFETKIWTVKTRGQVLFQKKKKFHRHHKLEKKESRKSTLVDNSDNKAKNNKIISPEKN